MQVFTGHNGCPYPGLIHNRYPEQGRTAGHTVAVFGVFGLRLIKSRLLLVSAGSFALMLLVTAAGISERQSGGATEGGVDESAMGRIHAWEAAFNMAIHNPMTGVGLSLFLDNYWDYATHNRAEGKAHVTHSTWFQIMSESGFIGLSLFGFMIFTVFVSIRRSLARLDQHRGSPKYDPHMTAIASGTYAGLAGFCISGTFLSQGFLWPVYIITAISIAIANYMDTHLSLSDAAIEKPTIFNRSKDRTHGKGLPDDKRPENTVKK